MSCSEPLPRTVRLLLLAQVVNQLGAFSLPFLTALISTDHSASLTAAGLVGAGPVGAGPVGAAFGLATIPSRLAGGHLADRIGRRTTIVLGLCGCAVAQLAIAASASLTWAVAGAVLLGPAFELYEPRARRSSASPDRSSTVYARSACSAPRSRRAPWAPDCSPPCSAAGTCAGSSPPTPPPAWPAHC
nr:MFS transporter [Streptomyces sp. I05A-00742]